MLHSLVGICLDENVVSTLFLYDVIARASNWVKDATSSFFKTFSSQIVPVSDVTKALPERNGSKATGDLVFTAELPPLGFSTYQVSSGGFKLIFNHK